MMARHTNVTMAYWGNGLSFPPVWIGSGTGGPIPSPCYQENEGSGTYGEKDVLYVFYTVLDP